MFEKGRSGNPGGRPKEKPWRDAINRAIKRHANGDLQALDRAADMLVLAAIEGKMDAMKEIGDRLDGKAVQQQIVNGDEDGGPVRFQRIERVVIDPASPNAESVPTAS